MTDTPRTEAELLTIFADNQNHDITAQDMRDFVVSGQNFYGSGLDNAAGVTLDTNFPTGIDVPDDSDATFLPFVPQDSGDGFIYDPNGWFQYDDVYPSPDWIGGDVPAGSWMLLPEGVYTINGFVGWKDDGNTTGRRTFYPADTCDNRVPDTDPQLDPFNWDPFYNLYQSTGIQRAAVGLALFSGFYYGQDVLQTVRVSAATAPVPFAVSALQTSGGTRQIVAGSIAITRTSPIGG